MTSEEKLEQLLDLIANKLILSSYVNTADVEDNQKFIRNGQLEKGAGVGVLALFQKDIKANQEDLNQTTIINEGAEDEQVIPKLQEIANRITDFDTLLISINSIESGISIELSVGGLAAPELITDLIIQDGGNFSNTSQFIPLRQLSSVVDIEKAEEFLDTNIYELLPSSDTRQSRIIRLFQELNALLPPTPPEFDLNEDGAVDREEGTNNWSGDTQYQQDNSISYAQNNQDGNIDEEDAFLHRLKDTANDTNQNRTIENIYNTILPYLNDLLEDQFTLEDIPKYKNQSSGYLQFRNLNQGVIIRNTNQQFIEGLNPNNPTYLNVDGTGGFTITTWVRFLDKTSQGTLFNFGNPTRAENPFGFKLETYVLDKDDGDFTSNNYSNYGEAAQYIIERDDNYPLIYENSNTARFVRLVVNDIKINGDQILRDSHVGGVGSKLNSIWVDENSTQSQDFRRLQTTFIPEDFQEWYFICASFNPIVDEDNSFAKVGPNGEAYDNDANFWLNHINPDDGLYTINSDYGNRCKVEIISRADLLRARGFKL
tara:strand:+ start:819 stop:2444 length:1626 start_codon:yes stop_codon:yes gene_type:complete